MIKTKLIKNTWTNVSVIGTDVNSEFEPRANMKGAGLMSCTTLRHQGAEDNHDM